MTKSKAVELDEQLIASQEFQKAAMASKLNWLRAGVLGANDGIMSTSGLLMGVAGATTDPAIILFTGVAAVVAGSIHLGFSTKRQRNRGARG
jgi:N-methylhydantoinase A/oxoprolinase/acetone carboxylase beta subunit